MTDPAQDRNDDGDRQGYASSRIPDLQRQVGGAKSLHPPSRRPQPRLARVDTNFRAIFRIRPKTSESAGH
jgi:hypothetical protein